MLLLYGPGSEVDEGLPQVPALAHFFPDLPLFLGAFLNALEQVGQLGPVLLDPALELPEHVLDCGGQVKASIRTFFGGRFSCAGGLMGLFAMSVVFLMRTDTDGIREGDDLVTEDDLSDFDNPVVLLIAEIVLDSGLFLREILMLIFLFNMETTFYLDSLALDDGSDSGGRGILVLFQSRSDLKWFGGT